MEVRSNTANLAATAEFVDLSSSPQAAQVLVLSKIRSPSSILEKLGLTCQLEDGLGGQSITPLFLGGICAKLHGPHSFGTRYHYIS